MLRGAVTLFPFRKLILEFNYQCAYVGDVTLEGEDERGAQRV